MAIVLGDNRYGKAETRVVRIVRDTPRHEIRDRNVSTALRGDFADAHATGDQAHVLPTDTQKNTVFAYAREHGGEAAESYAVAVADRLLEACPSATSAQVRVEEYAWDADCRGAGHRPRPLVRTPRHRDPHLRRHRGRTRCRPTPPRRCRA